MGWGCTVTVGLVSSGVEDTSASFKPKGDTDADGSEAGEFCSDGTADSTGADVAGTEDEADIPNG
ncbi:hypothetical protein P7H19_23670 [Paenibacillus larvae]|nr:hypothetical protein [Paenibacillus larvae]MDT2238681.1 hypothetical protein [Paenibacillus larvae]